MKNNGSRSDLRSENKKIDSNTMCITFKNLYDENQIKKELKKALLYFLDKEKLPQKVHFFIVGLGNDNFTSDSVGPKVLKELNVNAYVKRLGLDLQKNVISALEPGTLVETGIKTSNVIKSVLKEIKPNVLICIDSFVCETTKYLNHSLEITSEGLIPGSGLKGCNEEISKKTMGIPVLTIGVPTAIELEIEKNTYLLSTKDIDEYVLSISKIIGKTLNEILPTYGLK